MVRLQGHRASQDLTLGAPGSTVLLESRRHIECRVVGNGPRANDLFQLLLAHEALEHAELRYSDRALQGVLASCVKEDND